MKQAPRDDEALKIVVDLRDLAARSKDASFLQRLRVLRPTHIRKPAWIERLDRAGLRGQAGLRRYASADTPPPSISSQPSPATTDRRQSRTPWLSVGLRLRMRSKTRRASTKFPNGHRQRP